MKQKILLINDLPGYGKVAISAMAPILSHMGFDLYNLPTALVSNTLNYGKFEILDTSDYMKKCLAVWDELQFSFDAISTGFIVSEMQVELILDYCKRERQKGKKIFVDPIMGDNNKLYNGVSQKTVAYMRELCSIADYVLPNYTEAAFIAKCPPQDSISAAQGRAIIDKIRNLGAKNVIITSAKLDNYNAVIGYNALHDDYFELKFEAEPAEFPGTGDIFSAVFIGKILSGESVEVATRAAMDYIKDLIKLNVDSPDTYRGIQIEAYLDMMDEY
ncbi:MAG: phosphomethylpyrimidine kinase [Clostridiales bacterium]|nr:MAG: phosphomethylpyrimidine kinase [Clostridiales bacterium]